MKCIISGSFRKFYNEIVKLIDEFNSLGIEVLSPKKSKIINPEEEFVVLESDSKDKNIKQLEEEHLEAIKNSNFLYICNPKKYLGNSAIMEIGFAIANKKPIFTLESIDDITLSQFVKVASPKEAINYVKTPS